MQADARLKAAVRQIESMPPPPALEDFARELGEQGLGETAPERPRKRN